MNGQQISTLFTLRLRACRAQPVLSVVPIRKDPSTPPLTQLRSGRTDTQSKDSVRTGFCIKLLVSTSE